MKRKILIILLMIAVCGLFGQDHALIFQEKSVNDYKQKLDSLKVHNSFGTIQLKNFFTYDDHENLIEDIFILYDKYGKIRTQYSYAETGELISYVSHSWDHDSDQWIADEMAEYSYDDIGLLIFTIFSEWDTGTSTWIEDTKTVFSYDGEGMLTERIDYEWSPGTNDWIEDWRAELFYYANGKLNYQIDYKKWSDSWVKTWKHDYAYDNNERLSVEFDLEWNNNIWDSVNKFEYTYDSYGNLTMDISYGWDESGNTWVKNDKTESQYDLNYNYEDLVLPVLIEDWSWKVNNMLKESTYFSWDGSSSSWNEFYVLYYFYSDHIPGNVNEANSYHFIIYPNPATKKIRIMFDNYPIEQITIFDLSGIKVENVIPEHNEYDISMLPSGMYIVEVTLDGRKTREKLLVQ